MGIQYCLDELQAAYTLIKMDYIEEWTEKYISIARKYSEELDENIKRLSSEPIQRMYITITLLWMKILEMLYEKALDLGVETKIRAYTLALAKMFRKNGVQSWFAPKFQ